MCPSMKKECAANKRLKPSNFADKSGIAPCKEGKAACRDGSVTKEDKCIENAEMLAPVSEKQTCRIHSTTKCKIFAEPCVFSLERVSKILHASTEYKFCMCDSSIVGVCAERLIRRLVAEGVEQCKSKGRKTLFKDDVEHVITKRGLFFLLDLVGPRNTDRTCQ